VPADLESLSKGLEAMSRFFVGDATLRETLDRVSALACDTVRSADMVGITMLVEGRPRTAAFTDETAPEVDAVQYESGTGPCLDAFRHHQVFRIDDMEQDLQWAPFSESAAAHGIGSSLSVPLLARHEGVGALNFYARSRAAFSDGDVETALQFSAYAAIVLANSQAYWDAWQLGQDMAGAMRARTTVEQARGILMATQRCDADEAFQILMRAGRRGSRKLHEVAEEVVSTTVAGQSWQPPS
jgi:GAF domain-containing protein